MRHPWYIRLWQRCTLWSIELEGELTWWASDDFHLRKRKLDHEVRLPKWLFRPICWLTKQGHCDYYGECVICDKPMSREVADPATAQQARPVRPKASNPQPERAR